jgi:hypothetical protein
LILAGLILILAVVLISWVRNVRSHQAATYGVSDPSRAALRIENKTSDFAIARVALSDLGTGVLVQYVPGEIGMGAGAVLEVAPGSYLVEVSYAETGMVVMTRPKGTLEGSFTVSPGKAAILSFQGGRSSPEGMVFLAPELVFK